MQWILFVHSKRFHIPSSQTMVLSLTPFMHPKPVRNSPFSKGTSLPLRIHVLIILLIMMFFSLTIAIISKEITFREGRSIKNGIVISLDRVNELRDMNEIPPGRIFSSRGKSALSSSKKPTFQS